MYKSFLFSTLCFSFISFSQIQEYFIGGDTPLRVDFKRNIPLIGEVESTLFRISQGFVSPSQTVKFSLSKAELDEALGAPLKIKKEITYKESKVTEKDRCLYLQKKQQASFLLSIKDELYLQNHPSRKCRRLRGKKKRIAALRARGKCIPRSYKDILEAGATVTRTKDLVEEIISEQTHKDQKGCKNESSSSLDFSYALFKDCINNPGSEICLEKYKAIKVIETEDFWISSALYLNSVKESKKLPDLKEEKTYVYEKALSKLLLNSKGRNWPVKIDEQLENFTFELPLAKISSFTKEDFSLLASYEKKLQEDEKLEFKKLKWKIVNFPIMTSIITLKKNQMGHIQWTEGKSLSKHENFEAACKRSWDSMNQEIKKSFNSICQNAKEDELRTNYKLRIYFLDSNGIKRFFDIKSNSAYENFECFEKMTKKPCHEIDPSTPDDKLILSLKNLGKTEKENRDWMTNGKFNRLIELLTDRSTAESFEFNFQLENFYKFHIDMNNAKKIDNVTKFSSLNWSTNQ